MINRKKRIAIFFGGMGNEAGVSVVSAKNIYANIDRTKYVPLLIFWRKDGQFSIIPSFDVVTSESLKTATLHEIKSKCDVAFLITHGKYGEDGVLQAMLEAVHIQYTGSKVLGSALCMDKAAFKDIIKNTGIPQVPYVYFDTKIHGNNEQKVLVNNFIKKYTFPYFVKPSNSGSSVGVTKVKSRSQLQSAIKEALKHDSIVIIEKGLQSPREVEVGVLGNDKLIISPAGELVLVSDFYSFDDKYVKDEAQQVVPTKLSSIVQKQIQLLAKQLYQLGHCSGFARIDFFVVGTKVYFNEINTLPGFTNISMYPMLMKAAGVDYKDLISEIIELA
ncbi:D-alanine--D-alanine ligase [Candidatus Falkowbacteria bacterium]|nr:D-alanine--D-alanine ligase [Candidatus Falkowbacteria bacterium]